MKVVKDDSERRVHYQYTQEEFLQRLGIEPFTDKEVRHIELVMAMGGNQTFYLVEIAVKLSKASRLEAKA